MSSFIVKQERIEKATGEKGPFLSNSIGHTNLASFFLKKIPHSKQQQQSRVHPFGQFGREGKEIQ